MIEVLATKLAVKIKHIVPDHPASEAVLKFSLGLLINATSIIFLSIAISMLTGKTRETIIILFSFAILRQVSGGLHLKSGLGCVIGTTALVTGLSLLHLNGLWIQILNLVGIFLALIYAPSGIEKQSRVPPKFYPLLKVVTCFIIAFNILIQSPILALSYFVQCVTLIKFRR